MKVKFHLMTVVAVIFSMVGLNSVNAQTRVTFKAAKSSSSYFQMAVQLSEAIKKGSDGNIIITVEESQGSVQNVKEVGRRKADYMFTTPPSLVRLAMDGKKMFKDKSPNYQNIRSLFVIPSLTMHFVVSEKSGVKTFSDLAGKSLLIGKGSFGSKEAEKYVNLFGLKDKVKLINTELNNAVPALKNGQIDGFATSGSYPAPNVIEAAASVKVRLLNFSAEQIAMTKRENLIIPANTYSGVDYNVDTTSISVGAYATAAMDDKTAYELTKLFWEQKAEMNKNNPWWGAVTVEKLTTLGAKLHPGALKYYEEAGVVIPENLK